MTMEVLNVAKTRKMIDEHGWKLTWIIKQCELTRTQGYALFTDGTLPKDPARKARSLSVLSKLLGVEVPQILLTLEPRSVKRPA